LSNARFEFAESRIDDLYTKSLTRAALSLISSDLILRFEPRGIESFLINYYRAMNYLSLGEPEEAWVEWRKLAMKLRFARDRGDAPYLDPPFLHHLVGLGLEPDDPNDAYVSFRLAEAAYRREGGVPPADLVGDLVRLAGALGFADHLEMYRSRYGERAERWWRGRRGRAGSDDGAWARDAGEIVLLVEDGLVAPIEEVRVYIPITRARARRLAKGGEEFRLELAEALAREYHAGRYRRGERYYKGRREIAYVLPLAFPVFGRGEPAIRRVAAVAGGDTVPARVAFRVSELQRRAFEDRLTRIYAKTIARALIKYAAAQQLEKKAKKKGGAGAGDAAGVVANVVNVLTERADTRAWLGLPHRIWMARLRVPPGEHEVELVLDGRETLALGRLAVRPGERRIVNYRVF
jgi:hypothetical protein